MGLDEGRTSDMNALRPKARAAVIGVLVLAVLALSLGRKRVVTAQCEDLLAALQEVVDRPTFRATR